MLILKLIVTLFITWRLFRRLRRRHHSEEDNSEPGQHGLTPSRQLWALLLAHPYAEAAKLSGRTFDFYGLSEEDAASLDKDNRAFFRAPLLHQMGLPTDLADEHVRARLASILGQRWFRADLQTLQASDEPLAALAFACARMAFFARLAMLMKWIEPQAAWRVLLLNAQRAQDCFESWEDFGRAFLIGRRQWVAMFRADPLGLAFDEAALTRWLAPTSPPWGMIAWPGRRAFDPMPPAGVGMKQLAAHVDSSALRR